MIMSSFFKIIDDFRRQIVLNNFFAWTQGSKPLYKFYTNFFTNFVSLNIINLELKVSSYQADHYSVKIISKKLILFDL